MEAGGGGEWEGYYAMEAWAGGGGHSDAPTSLLGGGGRRSGEIYKDRHEERWIEKACLTPCLQWGGGGGLSLEVGNMDTNGWRGQLSPTPGFMAGGGRFWTRSRS